MIDFVSLTDAGVAAAVLDCLHEICGVQPSDIILTKHLSEYGIDFPLLVDLVVSLEDRLSVAIPNETLERVELVSDLVSCLTQRVAMLREQLVRGRPDN